MPTTNSHKYSEEEERQFLLVQQLALEPLSEGWHQASKSKKHDSIVLYQKMVPDIHDQLHLSRTHVTIDAPMEFVSQMLSQDNMPKILPLLKDHQIIETLAEGKTWIFLQEYTTDLSWFIANRCFVTLASSRQDRDQQGRHRFMYINSVVEHPSVSQSPKRGVVLGELTHNSIYCIEDNGKTHVVYLLLVDPKGNIPKQATEWNAGKTVTRMELMKKVAEELYAQAQKS